MYPGVFNLERPADLLAKLGRELDRLREDPANADHAFNFFVTAEHILDWLHPGSEGRKARKEIRESDALLETVSHLANGAKHLKLRTHHTSVKASERLDESKISNWADLGSDWFEREVTIPSLLVVHLDGKAAERLGRTISALDLAEQAYAYWSHEGRIPH